MGKDSEGSLTPGPPATRSGIALRLPRNTPPCLLFVLVVVLVLVLVLPGFEHEHDYEHE